MTAANVIDPLWVLSEESGKLYYENVRVVSCRPKQRFVVEHLHPKVDREWVKRYQRIARDRLERGIGDD